MEQAKELREGVGGTSGRLLGKTFPSKALVCLSKCLP